MPQTAMPLDPATQITATTGERERALLRRIEAEFREMPGLTLTLPQAARLFDIDAGRCECILDTLVSAGILTANGRVFTSARAGRRWA